jgi:NTE family protein
VGMGYHTGALKALFDWGIDPRAFDLIVGTSAGSVLGAYLRAGWSANDFYDHAHGRHPDSVEDPGTHRQEAGEVFTPLWRSRRERIRRGVGSAFAAVSSRGYLGFAARGREPAQSLKQLFPSGMYSTERTSQRFHADLPEQWPSEDIYVCAADLYTGTRVAFGSPAAPVAPYPDAVLASTAIPGVFPPVRIGSRYYVDGGVRSATSLDLAADAQCDAIVCIAPLGFRTDSVVLGDPTMWGPIVVRTLFARALRREVNDARSHGIDVFVIRPWSTELKAHGTNSMRRHDRVAVTEGALEGATRLLMEHSDHPALTPDRDRSKRSPANASRPSGAP